MTAFLLRLDTLLALLAMMRRRPPPSPPPCGGESAWAIHLLTLAVFLCGLLLVILALATRGALALDDPPPQLSGDRTMREGVWVVAVGGLFLCVAVAVWRAYLDPLGAIVPIVAALVCACWGGARVLLAAGAAARGPSGMAVAGALMLLIAASVTVLQVFLGLWRL